MISMKKTYERLSMTVLKLSTRKTTATLAKLDKDKYDTRDKKQHNWQ